MYSLGDYQVTLLTSFLSAMLLLGGALRTSSADIKLDQSWGREPITLPGPNVEIPHRLGRLSEGNNNLFHSFSEFNLATSTESATFKSPNSVQNIITRVTGGSSLINGLVRSETLAGALSGANLFFFNPAGVVFGPFGRFEVGGALHVSTANYLRLGKSDAFFYSEPSKISTLSAAPPSAFGFLGDTAPSPIVFLGSGSNAVDQLFGWRIAVDKGQELSVVAGDVEITNFVLPSGLSLETRIQAPRGRINLVSVGSAGEVVLGPSGVDVTSFSELGEVHITGGSQVDASGSGGGDVYIRGGRLVVQDSSFVASFTTGNEGGGTIDIEVTDSIELNRGFIKSGSYVASGRGPALSVKASRLELSNQAQIGTGVFCNDFVCGKGHSGDLSIEADTVAVASGASIFSLVERGDLDGAMKTAETDRVGNAGSVSVTAKTIFLSGEGILDPDAFTGIVSQTQGEGEGGHVKVTADRIMIVDGAQINANTSGTGGAGAVRVNAGTLSLLGAGSNPNVTAISAQSQSAGNAGSLEVTADDIVIANGAEIQSAALGSGDGGNLRVVVDNTLEIRDVGLIGSPAVGEGDAGDAYIKAGRLEVKAGAEISGSTVGAGDAGNVLVEADHIFLTSDGGILSFSGEESTGDAGALTLIARSLEISDGGRISANSHGTGNAGAVDITASSLKLLTGGTISTVTTDAGLGGTVTIRASDSIDISGFQTGITTATFASDEELGGTRAGPAGHVFVEAPVLAMNDRSVIDSSTLGDGNAGRVSVNVGHLELTGGASIRSRSGGIDLATGTLRAGEGAGGEVAVKARGSIYVSGASAIGDPSLISTRTGGDGNAGTVFISSPELVIMDGGVISSDSGIVLDGVAFVGSGNAGAVNISSNGNVKVGGPGSAISTSTLGEGNGGDILAVANDLELRDGGAIITESLSNAPNAGDAGNVKLTIGDTVLLSNGQIRTLAIGPGAKGAKINIDPQFVIVLKGSQIILDSKTDQAGDLFLTSDFFFISQDSVISATGGDPSLDGTIEIDAPDTDISGTIAVLPSSLFTPPSLLAGDCGAARAGVASSLVASGRGGLPVDPDGYLPSLYLPSLALGIVSNATVAKSEYDEGGVPAPGPLNVSAHAGPPISRPDCTI